LCIACEIVDCENKSTFRVHHWAVVDKQEPPGIITYCFSPARPLFHLKERIARGDLGGQHDLQKIDGVAILRRRKFCSGSIPELVL